MAKSLFNNGVDKSLDILKSYLFYIRFDLYNQDSKLYKIFTKFGGGANNALTIRARQAKWAGRSFEELSTSFMGSKVFYPGMAKVDGDLKIVFDEFQDTLVVQFLTAWMNLIFNSNFSQDTDANDNDSVKDVEKGGSSSSVKSDYSCDISVYMTDSTNKYDVPIYCKFYNCFPKEFSDISLDSTQNGNVKPEITYKYDYFEYKKSNSSAPNASEGPKGQNFFDY